jgi:hypothetical protein
MSGGSEDSSTYSANNSITLSPVDEVNNLSSNALLDFDVFENSIDCMADISHQDSSINGDIISVKEEMGLDDKALFLDDAIIIKEEPVLNIKEESIGALLDQSEDPCLNEGQNGNHFHQVQNLAGIAIQNSNNNNNNNGAPGGTGRSEKLDSSSPSRHTVSRCRSKATPGRRGGNAKERFLRRAPWIDIEKLCAVTGCWNRVFQTAPCHQEHRCCYYYCYYFGLQSQLSFEPDESDFRFVLHLNKDLRFGLIKLRWILLLYLVLVPPLL